MSREQGSASRDMSSREGSASRLAAARLERAQMRADAARKTPTSTSASSYGAFWGDGSRAQGVPTTHEHNPCGGTLCMTRMHARSWSSERNHSLAAGAPAVAAGISSDAAGMPMVGRTKSVDSEGVAGIFDGTAAIAGGGAGFGPYAPPDAQQAEIGVPVVPLSTSGAFAVATLEGALHENHDRGATAILPDGSVLFACLDGHGAEGASVSGYGCRNLLAGAASALQQGMSASDAVAHAFARTASTMAANVNDCRFSGSTAILTVLRHTPQGRVVTTGWVGDSRAVLARNRITVGSQPRGTTQLQPVPLTKDHKPTDPKERQRLQEARGIVRPSRVINPHTGAWIEVGAVRVWDSSQIYGVAMSRSLGDMQVYTPAHDRALARGRGHPLPVKTAAPLACGAMAACTSAAYLPRWPLAYLSYACLSYACLSYACLSYACLSYAYLSYSMAGLLLSLRSPLPSCMPSTNLHPTEPSRGLTPSSERLALRAGAPIHHPHAGYLEPAPRR